MKIERVNHAVFWVNTVCFVLHGVGYLAPAWFVKEAPLRAMESGRFMADGMMFHLPQMADDGESQFDEPGDGRSGITDIPRRTLQPWTKMPTPDTNLDMTSQSYTKSHPITKASLPTRHSKPTGSGTGSHMTKASGGRRPNPGWTKSPQKEDYSSSESTTSFKWNRPDYTELPTKGTRPPYTKPTTSHPSTLTMPTKRPPGQEGQKPSGPRGPRSKRNVEGGASSSDSGKLVPEESGIIKDDETKETNNIHEFRKPPSNHRPKPNDEEGGATGNNDAVKEEPVETVNPKPSPDEDSQTGGKPPKILPTNSNDGPQGQKPSEYGSSEMNSHSKEKPQTGGQFIGKEEKMKGADVEMMPREGAPLVYLSAGLWYGRACVNSGPDSSQRGMGSGAEWCTLYVRTKGSTLDRDNVMFELRLEASVAMGLSLLGLLVSATSCCVRRRPGLRMALAVTCLFLSGAVMAVPVVHTILEHFSRHELFTRDRDWDAIFVNTHAQHDLFDHWSVIVCGAASIISIFCTFVFVCIACRSPLKPGNRYELGVSELGEHPEKRNPQLSWMGSGKVTLPPGDAFTKQEPGPQKSDDIGDSKATPEGSSVDASARDGGDSVDSFEAVQEMTSLSFKNEDIVELSDSGYSVLDDVDETSETSIQ